MRIGLPREVKDGEYRVALTPSGVQGLSDVVVEPGAGAGVGFSDADYVAAGATLGDAWDCELVVKVKELQPSEYGKPRRGQTVFGFQHFGPDPELLDAALASGATFIAFETVGQESGLPILSPMSAIAGRLALQAGAWCLQKRRQRRAPAEPRRRAARQSGDPRRGQRRRQRARHRVRHGRMGHGVLPRRRVPDRFDPQTLLDADLVIGGVLTPGQMSPKLISRDMLRRMRPGSALVDVGIDQGGIAETSRPTSHSAPIYVEEGVVHYCVPNMPAACARTASLALERAVLPYARMLSRNEMNNELRTGLQVTGGKVVHAQLARDTGKMGTDPTL